MFQKKMNRQVRWLLAAWLLVAIGVFFRTSQARAYSATLTFSSDQAEYVVGDEIVVTVTVNSSAVLGHVRASIYYDGNAAEFVKGCQYIKEDGGILTLEDNKSKPKETKTYQMIFRAVSEGTTQVMLSSAATLLGADESEMSVSANRLSLIVNEAPESVEEELELESLDTEYGELTPAFDEDVTDYQLQVDADVETVNFNAVPKSEYAYVSITGNQELSKGSNTVKINVLGSNGAAKTYTVLVNRGEEKQKEEDPLLETDAQKEEKQEKQQADELKKRSFQIIQKNGKTVMYPAGAYTIMKCPEEDIPDGYIQTELLLNGVTVPAYVREGHQEDEFLLVYASHKKKTSFYRYDRMEKTLQRMENEQSAKSVDKTTQGTTGDTNSVIASNEEKISIVILVMSGGIFLLLIVIVMLIFRTKGEKESL